MAEKNTINTRLIIRNADISAWENSSLRLFKGEIALGKLSGDLSDFYEVRVGTDGVKTWNDLSGSNIIIPAANVTGLSAALSSVQSKYYETSAFEELPTENVTNGSIGIVSAQIEKTPYSGTAHVSRTAYWFDKETNTWKALDGNYSAQNVFFDDNIQITYNMGRYTGSDQAPGNVPAKGMSVQGLFADAWATTKQPSQAVPTVSIDGSSSTGEIGASYTLTDRKITFNEGAYTYDPKSPKISVDIGNLKIWAGSDESHAASNASMVKTGGTTTLTVDKTAHAYLSGGASYSYNGKATYLASPVQPKTNIGTDASIPPCPAGTCTASQKTITYTGYYPSYYGFTSSKVAVPTAITANNGNVTIGGVTYTRDLNNWNKTVFTASSDWYQLFYMIPAGKHSSWSGKDSNGLPVNVQPKTSATVTFLDGTTATYDVFIISNAAVASPTTCTMTFA